MRLSAIQLTLIQMGGVICMPAIIAGYFLQTHYGLTHAIAALIFGNAILWVISTFMLKIAIDQRLSTSECVKKFLGPLGENLCAIAYLICLMGWFSINQRIMISQALSLFGLKGGLLNAVGSSFIGVGTIYLIQFGVQKVAIFAKIAMPLMVGLMSFLVIQALPSASLTIESDFISLSAIYFVINLSLGMVFDIPTYYRHAFNFRSGFYSLTALFWILIPLIESVGIILGACHSGGAEVLFQADSLLMKIVLLAFILFSGMTTNNANLYSASINGAKIFSMAFKPRVFFLGLVGTLLSFLDIFQHLESVLKVMNGLLVLIGFGLLFSYGKYKMMNKNKEVIYEIS